MSKSSEYVPIIVECLQKKSLSYEKLKEEVRSKLNQKRIGDKNFKENLMKLLESGDITIFGYDMGEASKTKEGKKGKRFQSIPVEGLIFEWVKTDKTEITEWLTQLEWLIQLESPDEKTFTEAKKNLKEAFGKKCNKYNREGQEHYNFLSGKAQVAPLKDVIKESEEKIEEIFTFCSDKNEDPNRDETYCELKDNLRWYKRKYEHHPQAIYWKLNITKEEFLKLRESGIIQQDEVIQLDKIYFMDEEMDEFSNTVFREKVSREDFLRDIGISKPKIPSEKLVPLFNRILFYVNTHENHRFMKQSLSWALSDEKDSMDWFKLFIHNIPSQEKRLRKEFGINEKENTLQDKLMESQQIIDEHLNQTKKQSDEEQLIALIKKVAKKP